MEDQKCNLAITISFSIVDLTFTWSLILIPFHELMHTNHTNFQCVEHVVLTLPASSLRIYAVINV